MKVMCYISGGSNCMSLGVKASEEKEISILKQMKKTLSGFEKIELPFLVSSDRSPGLELLIIGITAANYSQIADWVLDSVPETFSDFQKEVDKHEKAVKASYATNGQSESNNATNIVDEAKPASLGIGR